MVNHKSGNPFSIAKRRGKLCTQFTKSPATVHTKRRAQRCRW
jgi:hypothetical protein